MLNSLRRSALRAAFRPRTISCTQPRTYTTRSINLKNNAAASLSVFQKRWNSSIQHAESAEGDVSKQIDLDAVVDSPPEPAEKAALEAAATTEADSMAEDLNNANASLGDPGRSNLDHPPPEENPPSKTLYVGNLFFEVNAEDLKEKFSEYGEVVSAKVMQDGKQRSRGFGYVDFADLDQANTARAELHRAIYAGREMVVQPVTPREPSTRVTRFSKESSPSTTLYVGNMSFELTDKDLTKIFQGLEGVRQIRVAIDRRTGQARGFCHVEFGTVEQSAAAREVLNQQAPYGRQFFTDFAAPSKGPTRAKGAFNHRKPSEDAKEPET